MNRTAYKNRHIKENYDRINFVIPKGEKDRIKKICSEIGASVNEYFYMLVCNDLADGTSRMAAKIPCSGIVNGLSSTGYLPCNISQRKSLKNRRH